MDAWGIDCLVTGSQKALMLPPGLGFVGLGPRALKRLEEVKAQGCYNLDLRRWLKSWQKNDVPFTPPVSLIRGQRVALELIEAEGLENVWARSAKLAGASASVRLRGDVGLEALQPIPAASVTGAFYPPALTTQEIRGRLSGDATTASHTGRRGQSGRGAGVGG